MPNLISVHVIGYPSTVGGANTELWHTVKLWRRAGINVTLHPTGSTPDAEQWRPTLDAIGCETVQFRESEFSAGEIVVGFCNRTFRTNAKVLRATGCKLIYVPCMVAPFPEERPESPLADRYVFQSQFQRDRYLPLIGIPLEHSVLIRGAFDPSEFQRNPLPHAPDTSFIVGKLCRAYNCDGAAAPEKYPADLWKQYARIPYPIHARVMGWGPEIEAKCGPPPAWAEVLPQGAETTQQFLESIHCLVPGVGCCLENWPRIALEADAVGVPIIAEKRGGWTEILEPYSQADNANHQAFLVAAIARGYRDFGRIGDWGGLVQQQIVLDKWLGLFQEFAA